jgi:hypothetical protein
MALLNILKSSTYSNIIVEAYDKHSKSLRFTLRVYEDSSKKKVLAKIPFSFQASDFEQVNVLDKGLNTPPVSPNDGDAYIIGTSPTGDWADRYPEEAVVWSSSESAWNTLQDPTAKFYVEDEEKFYQYSEEDGWVEKSRHPGSEAWSTYFDASLFDLEDQNLTASIYDYLKTLPEFSGALDG